jgi:hypothetical protein
MFPGTFLAFSLHISILLNIRTSHSKENLFSLKTQDSVTFQKSNPKSQKSSASKLIKEINQKGVAPLFEGPTNKDIPSKSIMIDNYFL